MRHPKCVTHCSACFSTWPMFCTLVDGGMNQSSVYIKIIDDYKHIKLMLPMEQIKDNILEVHLSLLLFT